MRTQGGFLISRIKQLGGRVFERILEREGVVEFTGPQGRILCVLWQEDMLPAAEVARRTSLANATLTSLLDRMEAAGLLERVPDRQDRRRVRVHLTEKARQLRERYDAVSERMNDIYYRDFSEQEVLAFEGYLTRVLDNLKEEENHEQNQPRRHQ